MAWIKHGAPCLLSAVIGIAVGVFLGQPDWLLPSISGFCAGAVIGAAFVGSFTHRIIDDFGRSGKEAVRALQLLIPVVFAVLAPTFAVRINESFFYYYWVGACAGYLGFLVFVKLEGGAVLRHKMQDILEKFRQLPADKKAVVKKAAAGPITDEDVPALEDALDQLASGNPHDDCGDPSNGADGVETTDVPNP